MKDIIVLGCGMVGSAMAADLAGSRRVRVADIDAEGLAALSEKCDIQTIRGDVRDADFIRDATAGCDIVVSAVPGFLGYSVLESIIRCGKNVVDISFFAEDPFELDTLARECGVVAVVDCGVAPGMDNIILGYEDARMEVQSFTCMVGGLPKERTKPFEYKAPFSPRDVIEEYCRPARLVENGEVVVREAMSEVEMATFSEVGQLEAFNTDGLRTLLRSMKHIPNMREKTLRYPGHIGLIRALRDAGFFSTKPVEVNGGQLVPLDITAKILIDQWKLLPGEQEFTVMRVEVKGKKDGKPRQITYELYDETDSISGTSSMARTTGYTCTAVVNLLAEGRIEQSGIVPPEEVGKDADNFRYILDYLSERGVVYRCSEE